jgi:hypothetical protein
VWWAATAAATAKTKAIGSDVDHRIQITEFSPTVLEVEENEKATSVFAGAKWSSDRDVRGFASILFEIIVGHPAMLSEAANAEEIPLDDIPQFVSELIKLGQSPEPRIGK